MKKQILLLVFLLCCGFGAVAQIAGTTLEEYNYATKGYKIAIDSGLDIKKGYKTMTLNYFDFKSRTIKLIGLRRENEDNLCATIIHFSGAGINSYFCLPNANSSQEIFEKYWNSLESLRTVSGCDNYRYLIWALSIYAQKSNINVMVNEEKK